MRMRTLLLLVALTVIQVPDAGGKQVSTLLLLNAWLRVPYMSPETRQELR
jgi:hypothetical protein